MKTKSKLVKKWLYTYLFLISISLIFIYSIYSVYNRSMKDDLVKLNRAYLEQIVHLLDNEFNSIEKLVSNIGLDSQFINVTSMDKELSTSNRYDIRSMTRNLALFGRANSLFERIDLYAEEPKLVMTQNSTYYDKYVDLYTQSAFGISSESYQKLMNKSYSHEVLRLKDWYSAKKDYNPLIYLQTLPIQFQNNPRGALMIIFNESELEKYGKREVLSNGKLIIFNARNQIIYANDPGFYNVELPIERMKGMTSSDIYIQDTDYIIDIISTSYWDWSYVSLVPKNIYFERINEVRTITLIMIIFFFLINLIIANFFSNRMYLPVKKIITSFKNQEMEYCQTEYEYIEHTIYKNTIEQDKMKRDLFLQKQSLKNAFFSKFLRGYIKDSIYMKEQFEQFNVSISNESYQVLLVDFSIKEESFLDLSLASFITQNIFHEILSAYYVCEIVELEGRIVLIINCGQEMIRLEKLEDYLNVALDMVNETYELNCIIGVSCVHTLMSDMPGAYQESLESIKHSSILRDCKIIYCEDIQKLSSMYEFSTEHEYKLIHLMKIGDLDQALAVIEKVIDYNSQEQNLKLDYIQCLMFDLIGVIIKSGKDTSFSKTISSKDPIRRIMDASSLNEMKIIIKEVATIGCELNASHFKETKKISINEEINTYIQKHYSDTDLNVSKLGDIFNMTPAYLSNIYKKETGHSILYALNKVRIEAAEKLLLETNDSINEISEKVGYLYCNAFIRFFKNQTGVTPGQYKQLSKK